MRDKEDSVCFSDIQQMVVRRLLLHTQLKGGPPHLPLNP